jgi:hypothetical protein
MSLPSAAAARGAEANKFVKPLFRKGWELKL